MNQSVASGERLREERQRLGLSQTAFGELAGVTKKSQALYESGDRSPDGVYFAAAAAAGVDIRYVITGQRSGSGIGETAVHQAVLDAVDLLSLDKKVDGQQLARAVVKLCARTPAPPPPAPTAPSGPVAKISIGGEFHGQLVEGGNSGNVISIVSVADPNNEQPDPVCPWVAGRRQRQR